MKIGVFGGTFDPPHIAHQILAAEALTQINLDLILWVLTPSPPHKLNQKITRLKDRIRMVEYAIAGNQKFDLSKVDIERDPPHYAIDTIKILKSHFPENRYYYLMGLDSLNDLSSWYMPADFIKVSDGIVVMKRVNEPLDFSSICMDYPELRAKLHLLQCPTIEISSSDIRMRVKNGLDYRYFVPEKVYRYINNNCLYID